MSFHILLTAFFVVIARRAALNNILGPKLSMFFLAGLPPLINGHPSTATIEMGGLGAVFMLYGLFAAKARDLILASAHRMRWLNRSFAAFFAALAGRLALERA